MTGEMHRTGEFNDSGLLRRIVVSVLILEVELIALFRNAVGRNRTVCDAARDVVDEAGMDAPCEFATCDGEALIYLGSFIVVFAGPGCLIFIVTATRSEERRVGQGCRRRGRGG